MLTHFFMNTLTLLVYHVMLIVRMLYFYFVLTFLFFKFNTSNILDLLSAFTSSPLNLFFYNTWQSCRQKSLLSCLFLVPFWVSPSAIPLWEIMGWLLMRNVLPIARLNTDKPRTLLKSALGELILLLPEMTPQLAYAQAAQLFLTRRLQQLPRLQIPRMTVTRAPQFPPRW